MDIEVKMEAGSKDYCINSHETSFKKSNRLRIPILKLLEVYTESIHVRVQKLSDP
jgi:hypothetical protein